MHPISTTTTTPTDSAVLQGGPRFHWLSYLLGLLTALVLVGGSLFLLRRPEPAPIVLHAPPTATPMPTAVPTATPGPFVVFVSGAVQQPGMVTLAPGARVGDAIAAVGGLLPDADPALVNQAQPLYDGAQVHVPAIVDAAVTAAVPLPPAGLSGVLPTATPATRGASDLSTGPLVNLNTATEAELDALPGIGPSKAQEIIAQRPYATVDDLDRVPGIGAATLERLRPLVTAP